MLRIGPAGRWSVTVHARLAGWLGQVWVEEQLFSEPLLVGEAGWSLECGQRLAGDARRPGCCNRGHSRYTLSLYRPAAPRYGEKKDYAWNDCDHRPYGLVEHRAGNFASARGETDQDGALQVERFDELCTIFRHI